MTFWQWLVLGLIVAGAAVLFAAFVQQRNSLHKLLNSPSSGNDLKDIGDP